MSEFDSKLETINKIFSLLFKFGIIIGGAILLSYAWRNSFFPGALSIGDGLLFIFVAMVFALFYMLFTISITCLGLKLKPMWLGVQWVLVKGAILYEKASGNTSDYKPFKIVKTDHSTWVFALIGLLFLVGFSLDDSKVLIQLILVMWVCAFMYSNYIERVDDIIELEKNENKTENDINKIKSYKGFQKVFLAAVLFTPLLVGGVTGRLSDGVMRAVGVKLDNTSVHIKMPYVAYLENKSVKGTNSSFGNEYKKYNNIDVIFSGFGKEVVLDVKVNKGESIRLNLPSDSIYLLD